MNQIFLVISFFVLYSCTSKTKPQLAETNPSKPDLFIHHYLRYEEDGGKLIAESSVKKGENEQNAKPFMLADGIRFENKKMRVKNLNAYGMRYAVEATESYKSIASFSFVDDLGKSHIHSVGNALISDVVFSLNSDKSGILRWNGAALSKTEVLVLRFESENYNNNINILGPTDTASFIFEKEQLTGLPKGNIKLYLIKKNRKSIEPNGQVAAGSMLFEYYFKPIEVRL